MTVQLMPISREDVDAGLVDFSDVIEPGLDSGGPIHPGENLLGFIEDYGWSARELARRLAVPHNRVLAILAGERSVTADTALRLATLFRTSPEFWLNLQMRYDLERSRAAHGSSIAKQVEPVQAAPTG
jgi:antitoxin HigA-1